MSHNSILDNAFDSLRRKTSFRESLRILRSSSKDSLKSAKSSKKRSSSSYQPYAVYEQTMAPIILRDPEATTKLLEAILDSPNGRRSLSRLARTSRAFADPALNVLWRDLDSVVPIVGLFPGHLFKKARKPSMGLVRPMYSLAANKRSLYDYLPEQHAARRGLEGHNQVQPAHQADCLRRELQQCHSIHFHRL